MFLITPSALLTECPRCQSDLSSQKNEEHQVECVCGYTEPGSSARVLTFIESALDNYLRTINIDTFRYEDKTYDSMTGVNAAGCLPVFVARAAELFDEGAGKSKLKFDLSTVADTAGFMGARCVTKNENIDVTFTLLSLIEVIHEALDLRPIFEHKHGSNELPIKHLVDSLTYGEPNSAMDVSVKRSMTPETQQPKSPGY